MSINHTSIDNHLYSCFCSFLLLLYNVRFKHDLGGVGPAKRVTAYVLDPPPSQVTSPPSLAPTPCHRPAKNLVFGYTQWHLCLNHEIDIQLQCLGLQR